MSTDINIEEIMEEIRQNIKERGYDKEPLSFDEIRNAGAVSAEEAFHIDVLAQETEYLKCNWNNALQPPLAARNKLLRYIKTFIFRAIKPILFPIVNYQNAYNMSNARCMNQLKEYVFQLEQYKEQIELLQQQVQELKERAAFKSQE